MSWTTDKNGKRVWADVDDQPGFVCTFSSQCCDCKKVFSCNVDRRRECYMQNVIICNNRIPDNSEHKDIDPPQLLPREVDEIRAEAESYPPDLKRKTLKALDELTA